MSFSVLAQKLGEDASPAVQDCKTYEHCNKCLKAHGCDLAINNNTLKIPRSNPRSGSLNGGKKKAINQ